MTEVRNKGGVEGVRGPKRKAKPEKGGAFAGTQQHTPHLSGFAFLLGHLTPHPLRY